MKITTAISISLIISCIHTPAQNYEKVFLVEGDTSDYYYQVVPEKKASGLLILLPGARGDAEWPLKTTKIPYMAAEEGLVTIMISYETWLGFLTDEVLELLNESIDDVIRKHNIPGNKCVIGGFSSGGNMALSYAEFAYHDSLTTAVIPKGVFALDPPVDLTELYNILHQEIQRSYYPDQKVNITEETKSMHEQMTRYLGTPWDNYDNYVKYSPFLLSEKYGNGGMAINLKNLPVRIYSGFDSEYFNRKAEECSLYSPGSPLLISFLRLHGNKNATFKNQYDEDYNPQGGEEFRGRHAWKGFDSRECVDWILKTIE
ncbi:hypothetical protein ACFLSP_00785 [Bacteroidota bacterium]